jgi:hypothetical protein
MFTFAEKILLGWKSIYWTMIESQSREQAKPAGPGDRYFALKAAASML